MSELKSRVAYLQGLAEGLSLEPNSKEGKLFSAIIGVLDDIVHEVEEMSEKQVELESYIEAIDEDLGDLEENVYEDDDEYDFDEEDYEDDEDDMDEGSYVEIECPKCHDVVRFDSSILEDEDAIEVTCPNCDEVVYVNDDTLVMGDKD